MREHDNQAKLFERGIRVFWIQRPDLEAECVATENSNSTHNDYNIHLHGNWQALKCFKNYKF